MESGRLEDALYLSDKVRMVRARYTKKMSGIGNVTCKQLTEIGIVTVGDVVNKMNAEKVVEIYAAKKLESDLLNELVLMCSTAIPTNAPKEINHTKHTNWYESKYGEN